jgi:predicted Zn-dependent peptidase
MKYFSFSMLFLLFWNMSVAQTKINYLEYDLPNGIHVILHEEHSTPIVAVSVLYHVGSKNENTERTGFAHFFEHLLFEGSENIGRGEYSKLVEKNGGTLNANTSQDRTYYYEILPSNQLELGLWLESERMLHAKVENVGIETQRSVVKEEKRQRVDNQPYASFISEMFKRAFPSHPYRWVPIGSMEHLDAAVEADYVQFYQDFYVPNNATISIAGDIPIEKTKLWIEQYFGSIPSGQAINLYRDVLSLSSEKFVAKYGIDKSKFDAKDINKTKDKAAIAVLNKLKATPIVVRRTQKDKEPIRGIITDTIYDNIQLPAIFMGYKIPDQKNADSYALEFMNEILSGSNSSRINKNLIEKKQIATYASSFNYGLEDGGMNIFLALAKEGVSLNDIQAAFDIEIRAMKDQLISDEEYQSVLNKFEKQVVESTSSVAGIAESLADNYVYYGTAARTNQMLEMYRKVTKEDIQRVANTYLTDNARVILYYLPTEK